MCHVFGTTVPPSSPISHSTFSSVNLKGNSTLHTHWPHQLQIPVESLEPPILRYEFTLLCKVTTFDTPHKQQVFKLVLSESPKHSSYDVVLFSGVERELFDMR